MARGDEDRLVTWPAKEQFLKAGWTIEPWTAPGGHRADFLAISPSGKRIVIEAKNYRSDERSVDFWTLLGQVVVNTEGTKADRGVLIPIVGLSWFKQHLPPYARRLLGIRIFVLDSGRVFEVNSDYDLTALKG